MKRIYPVLIVLLCSITAAAQNTNKVWAMGHQAGIDFNTTPPVAIYTGIHNMAEGCASISDNSGQLLMYSAMDTVYNRNHRPMPNGHGIVRAQQTFDGTCTQASLIVPIPGSSTKYYVFSLEADERGFGSSGGRLFYSIIDMSLDGGLGDVIAGQKAILLDSFMHEKMTAVAGCHNNVWVVARPRYADEFRSYEITTAGINTRVVKSPTHSVDLHNYTAGVIKFSPDGTKMVSVNNNYGDIAKNGVQLFNFNRVTGQLYDPISLGTNPDIIYPYGACFSPDNTKLYVTESSDIIWQYDLSTFNTPAIIASKINVSAVSNQGPAPPVCWLADMQTGPDGKIYVATTRSFVDVIEYPNVAGIGCNHVREVMGFNSMDWIVSYGLPNAVVNAAAISNSSPRVQLSDTAICPGLQQLNVSAQVSYAAANAQFTWGPPAAILSSNGRTAVINPALSSSVYLVVTNSGEDGVCNLGPVSDTMYISDGSCSCRLYLPNAFSPNGDGHNDFFAIQAASPDCFDNLEYSFLIFNRWGEKVYEETQKGPGWNGTHKGQPAATDTYYYILRYKSANENKDQIKKGDITLIR